MLPCTDIDTLASRIASAFRPDRIVLFGSRPEDEAAAASDRGLLVVLDFGGSNYAKAAEIYAAALPCFDIDIIVHRPGDIESRYAMGDPVVRDAIDHGAEIYRDDRVPGSPAE